MSLESSGPYQMQPYNRTSYEVIYAFFFMKTFIKDHFIHYETWKGEMVICGEALSCIIKSSDHGTYFLSRLTVGLNHSLTWSDWSKYSFQLN